MRFDGAHRLRAEQDVLRALERRVDRDRSRTVSLEQVDSEAEKILRAPRVEQAVERKIAHEAGIAEHAPASSTGGKAGMKPVLARK